MNITYNKSKNSAPWIIIKQEGYHEQYLCRKKEEAPDISQDRNKE